MYSTFPSPVRFFAVMVLFLGITLLSVPRGKTADSPPMEEKSKPSETKKTDLFRLKNDDLLKQAQAIYDKANEEYLAALRNLEATDLLLNEATAEENDQPPPAKNAPKSKREEESQKDSPKELSALEQAKSKADSARKQLKRVQQRKELLDRLTLGLDAAGSASLLMLNTLDDLKPFAIEVQLRIKDGTLPENKAPAQLSLEAIASRKKEIAEQQLQHKDKITETQKAQLAIGKELETSKKSLQAAEAEVTQSSKSLAQEQKRQEMEKAYLGKDAPAMLADLGRLVDEGDGLKGSYELALARFRSQLTEVDGLRKTLAALKAPEVKIPQLSRAEDVEVAARAIQELIAFYTTRIRAITELRDALQTLVKQGGEFEADAAVSYEHLFKMRVVSGLLGKAGVAENQFPDGGQPSRVEAAAGKQSTSAAEVQAGTENARAELIELSKRLLEATQAHESSRKQLDGLKQSQQVTMAVLKWEEQLRGLAAEQLNDLFVRTRKEYESRLESLKQEVEQFQKASSTVKEARGKLNGLKDPFLRKAEEEGQSERAKITGELRKEAGLDRAAKESVVTPPMESKKEENTPPRREKNLDPRLIEQARLDLKSLEREKTELEKTTESLTLYQQTLAARVRVLDEQEDRKKELLAALAEFEKQAQSYQAALTETRKLSLQLNAAASEIKKRIGKGEMPGDKIPYGVTEALRGEARTKLEAESANVLTTLTQIEQDREAMKKPDPDGETLKVATKELLTAVGGRIDLLSDLKKLSDDYQLARKDRPASEVKRLEQLAADRQADDADSGEWLLSLDTSKAATNLEELLATYYLELAEIEEKNENLAKRKKKVESLVELTRKENAAVVKILPLIDRQIGQLQTAQEEEFILTRARLKPDQADELLKNYQTKSGRLLGKPVPLGDQEKSEKVEELAGVLFERLVRVDAARRWSELLSGRLAPAGIKAEAGVYQDEVAQVNATNASNLRRITALTGIEPVDPNQPPPEEPPLVPPSKRITAGEIGKTRGELFDVRSTGIQSIGIKIGIILLAAFLLPRIVLSILRRTLGGGGDESSLVLSALGAFIKAAIWVIAFALILSVLGFDVTAIIAGLGIGGLAIGLAAQPMISDVIAAMVIFAERKFAIGDVIRMGGGDPARVIGLSWRSTQLRNKDGLTVNVPNRKITEESVQNLTRDGKTYDTLSVAVTTDRDIGFVLETIRRSMDECESLMGEHGVSVQEFTRKGETTIAKYQFWWFLSNYESRNPTRDAIFKRVARNLEEQNLKGTEVTLI